MIQGWNTRDIPDQSGRTAVVTGANSGLGLVTARELARHGARVLLACRDEERGGVAAERIRRAVSGADVAFAPLDLADLASVRKFAASHAPDRIELLVNNAGVMALPYGRTADGFETQFGVNHLGHYALTGLLLPALRAAGKARVVTVSSGLHALADIDMGDLNSEHHYRRWIAYGASKSANLLFVHEFARLLARSGSPIVAAAAHPGYASTNLATAAPRLEQRPLRERVIGLGNLLLAQTATAGALPVLYAATAPGVRPDSFTGPGRLGWRGAPAPSWRARRTRDDVAGERLWSASQQLTGVTYPGL
ncbi:oxidoreductase [Streptomyces sp. NBC_00102]|uniref:oxidoreductase n=1 Tax=Streptomyces sp. NBC_00102 TaxID=2975652 RepID=UPI0022538A0B|nr:oxidoreductase [Streptomyces sp. NBC_00102]MCX5396885.1 oxidoreductase [Streptomyces sp. NBC_00102]